MSLELFFRISHVLNTLKSTYQSRKEDVVMPNFEYLYFGRRSGNSEKGTYYIITLMVTDLDSGNSFSVNSYVDKDIFDVTEEFQRCQPVACIWVPTTTGRAKLAYLAAA